MDEEVSFVIRTKYITSKRSTYSLPICNENVTTFKGDFTYRRPVSFLDTEMKPNSVNNIPVIAVICFISNMPRPHTHLSQF